MLSKKQLRNDIELVAKQLSKRNFSFDINELSNLENSRKKIQVETQDLQNLRNTKSKSIGKAKAAGEDIQPLLAEVADLGDKLDNAKNELNSIQEKIENIAMSLPNTPHESVPEGNSEDDNIEVSKWGEPASFDFAVKDHVDLGELHGLDFATAAKISGARFSVMTGKIARMHRALTQFMLDQHTEVNGYTETYVPYLVNSDSLRGTGQLPKFEKICLKPIYMVKRAKQKPYI